MKLIGLVILLASAVLYSQDHLKRSSYSISSFSDTTKSIPASGNNIILPFSESNLKQLPVPPEQLGQSEVLLRRRFSASEYGLYIGALNPAAYKRLSAFKYPAKMTFSRAIKMKFYRDISDNPDCDIENVYFDSDFFYLENTAKVFYQDSIWYELGMLDALPGRLSITSDPPGAQVFMDNKPVGVTPLSIGAVFNPSAIVRLEMKGYFIVENFLDFPQGVYVEKSYALKKKPQFEDGSEIDLRAYTAENTDDVTEIDQRIAEVNDRVKKIVSDSVDAIVNFEKTYSALPPKDQFETSTEFQTRKQQFDAKFQKELDEFKNQFHAKTTEVLSVIPGLRQYREELKNRVYTKYFDGTLLKLSPYNADSGFFPVTMVADENGFAFTFSGKLLIPRDEAREFYFKGTGSGKIALCYKNWRINVFRNNTWSNYFVDLTSVKLRFKEKDYKLTGSFSLPDFISGCIQYTDFTIEKSIGNNTSSNSLKHPESKQQNIQQNIQKTDSLKPRKVNPQGYCGSVNPSFLTQYNYAHVNVDYDYYWYDDIQDDVNTFNLVAALTIPATTHVSFFTSSNILLGENWSICQRIGSSIFSKSVKSLEELDNPFGQTHSIIITPYFDFLWGDPGLGRFCIGTGLSFVATKRFSISTSINYNRFPIVDGNGIDLWVSPCFYFPQNKNLGRNPDGKIGSISLKPSYCISFVPDGQYQQFGIELSSPFKQSLTWLVAAGYSGGGEEPTGVVINQNGFYIATGINLYAKK